MYVHPNAYDRMCQSCPRKDQKKEKKNAHAHMEEKIAIQDVRERESKLGILVLLEATRSHWRL